MERKVSRRQKKMAKLEDYFLKFAMESKAEKNCRNAHLPNDLL